MERNAPGGERLISGAFGEKQMHDTAAASKPVSGALDRRNFLMGSAALAGAGLWGSFPAYAAQLPNVVLGSKTLTTLSDGNLVLPLDFVFSDAPQTELTELLLANDQPTDRVEPPCNVTIFRDGARLVIFDVGAGSNFLPSAGKLPDSLAAAGIDPSDVTDVIFTHAHPDHIWGLLDDFDEVIFPEANYHIGRVEWDYWRADDTLEKTPEARQSFVVGAQNRLAVLEERIQLFEFGDEVISGVEAIDTSGHTPGHTAFAVHDGSDSVMIIGDAVTNTVISFARPEWPTGSDQNPHKGAETRLRLLDRLALEKSRLIGFHLTHGGIGHVEKNQSGYRFAAG
jgi:glyoxylase-like metal-dependent hydrolase (beta-lactamase superfamily II)